MKAACSSETLVPAYHTTRCHIPRGPQSQISLHAHCTASCQLGWEHFGQRELRKEWTEQTSDCTEKYGTGGDLGVRNTSEDCYYHSEINVTKKRNEWNGTKRRIGSKTIYHLRTDTKHYLYICLVHTAVPTDTAKQIQTTSCNRYINEHVSINVYYW